MRIHLTGVFVDDQRKALRFYTETLGFQVKQEVCGSFSRQPTSGLLLPQSSTIPAAT